MIDPCVGSGHFLSYAFDILLEIYREYGWSDRDAAMSIIENNLYGLDIDDRAAQLACFAVMMKARKYNRRIINGDTKLHILAMQDSTFMTDELIKYVADRDASIRNDLNELCIVFNNAKEYGSIINVPQLHYDALYARIQEIESTPIENLIDVQYQRSSIEELLPLIRQAEILAGKYDVVATNPPYMNKYSARLKAYIGEHYEEYKGDLFSVFVYRNFGFCKQNGYSGFMTPMVWMFIKTYESLRKFIITNKSFITLIQFEYSAFEEATVPICSFVLKNGLESSNGMYFKLSDFRGGMETQRIKIEEALNNPECGYYFEADSNNFSKIPGAPVAYWVGKPVFNLFGSTSIYDVANPCKGIDTGDNNRFLRQWYEVPCQSMFFPDGNPVSDEEFDRVKWFPYNKGGAFRKWYGNNEYVVDWSNRGETLRSFPGSNLRNRKFYFRNGITWGTVTSGGSSFRVFSYGFLFDNGGCCLFDDNHLQYVLALLNSSVFTCLSQLSPTLNLQPGDVGRIPFVYQDPDGCVASIADENIALARIDWDSFETSWDFQQHPLVGRGVPTVAEAYALWEGECAARFAQLKANEEELNRIFIDIYGLQDELTPEVEDKDVTVRRADLGRDIRSFISYAVGCMFGRYSICVPGLLYAGGTWNAEAIRQQIWDGFGKHFASHDPMGDYEALMPDRDGILPICDDEYFGDDIVGRFVQFVETIFGKDTLEENLRFIAKALGGKGTPREVIRSYFLNDFYADHLKIYQKRPIYWLFSSGKKNGFKCLIYMHRYQPDLLARIRTDYVHEQQERYRTQLQMAEDALQAAAASERVKLNKRIAKLKDQALELQKYEEKIHHLADQMIPIDLDDGVKVNYARFQDVLEKIK